MTILEFPLAAGGTILVSASPEPGQGLTPAGRPRPWERIDQSFDEVLERLRPVIGSIVTTVHDLPALPDEVEVEFGVAFHASGNALLVTGEAEANLRIALKWASGRGRSNPVGEDDSG